MDHLPASLAQGVIGLCARVGLPSLPPHLPLAVASFGSFFALQALSSVLSPRLFPLAFKTLKRKTRLDWDLHFTGWIHALVATPLSLLLLLRPSPAVVLDPIFAYAPTEGSVFALSAGYFYYDLVVSLWHVKSHGPAFVLHALSCCFIFTAVWRPLLMGIGSRFLIWEFSTIFLHPHWFLDKVDMTGSTLQMVNGGFLVTSFLSARIIYGASQTVFLWRLLDDPRIGPYYRWGFRAANIALNLLNWSWFRLMILSLKSRLGPKAGKYVHDKDE